MESGYNEDDAERVAALVRKEGLKKKEEDPETQVLEDVACLVFLDDRLEGFERDSGIDEEKMLEILRKSVAKMSDRGRALAGEVVEGLGERGRELVRRALEG